MMYLKGLLACPRVEPWETDQTLFLSWNRRIMELNHLFFFRGWGLGMCQDLHCSSSLVQELLLLLNFRPQHLLRVPRYHLFTSSQISHGLQASSTWERRVCPRKYCGKLLSARDDSWTTLRWLVPSEKQSGEHPWMSISSLHFRWSLPVWNRGSKAEFL